MTRKFKASSPSFLALGLLALLQGCSTHSVNEEPLPLAQMPESFSARLAAGTAGTTPATSVAPWYTSFNDPKLNDLIQQALAGSYDIKQAAARYKQASALTTAASAARLPEVGVGASAGQNLENGQGSAQVGATLDWEIDLFNRLGSAARADQRRADAAAADVEAVRFLISTEVAEAYFGAVAREKQLALIQQQVEADKELLKLNKLRFNEGIDTQVEVLQQRGQLSQSKSLVPLIEADRRVFENRLDILLGSVPDNNDRVSEEASLALPPALPATGTPSDLLLNRPDLKAMRLDLVAADNDIAAAIADRLPHINLTGNTTFVGGDGISGPVSSIIGSLVQPLFDWGKRKAAVTRNKALYEEKLYAFGQAYITAVGDVENALYQEQKQRDYLKRLEKRRQILEQTLTKTKAQYTQGLTDYLPVLGAVKDLRQVERDLITEQEKLVDYRIQLHRALGTALPLGPDVSKEN